MRAGRGRLEVYTQGYADLAYRPLPILVEDAAENARKAVAALNGRLIGQDIDALTLNFGMLGNHESTSSERASGLCWVMHIGGDSHQPWLVTEPYSVQFPDAMPPMTSWRKENSSAGDP